MTERNDESQNDLIELFEKNLDFSNEFPFLMDKRTVEFVKNSQVNDNSEFN